MSSYWLDKMVITTDKRGGGLSKKSGTPVQFGTYTEIRTTNFEFQFNQYGEIKFIRGLTTDWPHPSERLKRTDGNDWVYYTVGKESGEKGIISWLGEYYLPCLSYQSNSIWGENPFMDPNIMCAMGAWSQLYADIYGLPSNGMPHQIKTALATILQSDESTLHQRSKALRETIGGRLSVLPPDARHVDYEVIPLVIADGCRYHCHFCSVQSKLPYQHRSKSNILGQIEQLKKLYGPKVENYNALFLGNHDALGVGSELVCLAASEAFRTFNFEGRIEEKPRLFLFGSVDSLLKIGHGTFDAINALPFYTYINVGFESMDEQTLKRIGKPLSASRIDVAFEKLLDINRRYTNIEVTCNFLMGGDLSREHHDALTNFLACAEKPLCKKGTVYLSPLMNAMHKNDVLKQYFEIKRQSRLNICIYLIQRL